MKLFVNVSPNVHYIVAAAFGILLFATILVLWLRKRKPQKNYHELQQRINSWWFIVSSCAIVIHTAPLVGTIFFGIISALALREFMALAPKRTSDSRVILWAYLSIPIQYYWIYSGWYHMCLIFIPVYLFLLLPMRMVFIGNVQDFLRTAGIYHWGLMTTVFCLGHLAFFSTLLTNNANPIGGNAGYLLFLLFLTELNDVAQYCWGKLLGKHKIIPKVSPNKTVEGFLGGMATTMLATYFLAPMLTPITGWRVFLAGFIFSAGGFVGDVVISAVKRDMNIKDTGAIIPGHGGILDRVDSLTYTAPLFFHFVRYFYN